MPLNLTTSKYAGSPDDIGWSQIHDFTPNDPEKKRLRGQIIALISVKNSGAISQRSQALEVGHEILLRLHEEYFGKLTESAFSALKESVGKVFAEFVEDFATVEMVAAVFLGESIYFACAGGARAKLFRENKVFNIVSSSFDKVSSASGIPQDNDVFILGTSNFYNQMSTGVLRANLATSKVKDVSESLAPIIHSFKSQGNVGVVFIGFAKNRDGFLPMRSQLPKVEAQKFQANTLPDQFKGVNFSHESLGTKIKEKSGRFGFGLFTRLSLKKRPVGNFETDGLVSTKRARKFVLVGLVLLLFLSLGVSAGLKQKKQREYVSGYEDRLNDAIRLLDEATSIYSINPETSRDLFSQSKELIVSLKDEGVEDSRLTDLESQLNAKEAEILGAFNLEVEEFLNLSLLTKDFVGDAAALYGTSLYILDKDSKRVVSVDIETKRTEIEVGPAQISSVNEFAVYDDRVFVLNNDGIFEVGVEKKIVEKKWEGDALFTVYSGNVYLVDKAGSQIYRYQALDQGFSSDQKWFTDNTEVDLSSIRALAIDGSIWVQTSDTRILKFTQGVQRDFAFTGVFPRIESIDRFYTNELADDLYVFENHKERLVAVDKNGGYVAQYRFANFGNIESIVVSQAAKKVFFLAGEKVFVARLNHLD